MPEGKVFDDIGLMVPDILLPSREDLYDKWPVIACDQHKNDPDYWESVRNIVGGAPTTLNLIYPEVYLGKDGVEQRIQAIHGTMGQYLRDGILVSRGPGFVLVDRQISHENVRDGVVEKHRTGLMVALDLEQYDYKPASTSLIRATEKTIEDRLPPRMDIRRGAPIELPHILVLIDDPTNSVMNAASRYQSHLLYSHFLMQQGSLPSVVKGYHITDETTIDNIAGALSALKERNPILYAMGDGNHSLATAKAIWEQIKASAGGLQNVRNHPARYALVELVNIHDNGLTFEPIHRIVTAVNDANIFRAMQEFYTAQGSEFSREHYGSEAELTARMDELRNPDTQLIRYVTTHRQHGLLIIKNPKYKLSVVTLQTFLDKYMEGRQISKLEYEHGVQATRDLAIKPNNIGFLLPAMEKSELFAYVAKHGILPEKSFSLGEARDKRYYIEARKIA